MSRSLEGKVAIVVGAGPGIGRSTALALAEDGADVVVAARRSVPLEALAKEIATATGRKVLALPTDATDLAAGAELIARTVSEYGRLDVLVNVFTGGGGTRESVAEMDWDGYLDAVNTNIVATLELSGLAAARMAEGGGGAVINIGTLSSTSLVPKLARYSSTKAAMVSASKTMALEVGHTGVRVNVVTPGFTKGPALDRMFDQMAARSGGDANELKTRAARKAALGRHVDPEDIADAVVFLASDRGRNITGVELHVNGGLWIA